MSWALSSELLAKNSKIDLYTDEKGYDLLINQLNLPYTNVYPIDQSYNFGPSLWAVSKIETYKKQKKPFIHIDGDVFCWENITRLSTNEDSIFVQNIEKGTKYYGSIVDQLKNLKYKLPSFMESCYNHKELYALNLGIFGSRNIPFIHEYTDQAIDFLSINERLLKEVNSLNLNVIFEQLLLYYFAIEKGIKIDCHLDEVYGDIEYEGFGDFHKVPQSKKYLHLIGEYKKNYDVCRNLESTLVKSFPATYEKIERLFYEDSEYRKNHIFPNTYYLSSKFGIKVNIEEDISIYPNTQFNVLCENFYKLELDLFTKFYNKPEEKIISNKEITENIFDNPSNFIIKKNKDIILEKNDNDFHENDETLLEAIKAFIKSPVNNIAVIPCNHSPYYKYSFVDEIDLALLSIVEIESKLDNLLKTARTYFDDSADEDLVELFIKDRILILIFNNLFYINQC